MAHKLYQVTFRWVKTPAKSAELEPSFASLGDWARLNAYSWFVLTQHTSSQVYETLRSQISAEDNIIIIATNPSDYYGWAPPWFWNWLAQKQTQLKPPLPFPFSFPPTPGQR